MLVRGLSCRLQVPREENPSALSTSSAILANSGCIRRVPTSSIPTYAPLMNIAAPRSSWDRPARSRRWRSSAPHIARVDWDGSMVLGLGMGMGNSLSYSRSCCCAPIRG